ncbi:MobA/MobL family protein [Sinorhizobium arboris]|uniref:MobA/MobL family protein n=1 Tax=Sinorhizobium arboris TaxID=76745 RepID=UPI001F227D42|nr:MobA/MobL family protein [Sinorhizobium arboris]
MAIYHLNVKNISRGDGRSIVAAAAYRAGETLPNEAEERRSEFGGRRDVVANEIRLPENAPRWMADRAQLWNAVETAEIRKDARLAKEVKFALPVELPPSAWLTVARIMADAYAAQEFAVDLAIHEDGTRHNPHVHLLMTTRVITADGFGPKIRSADGRQFVADARSLWERVPTRR